METASEEEKRIFRLEFVEGMTGQMASEQMHVSTATYYRRRQQLVRKVARELEA